MMDGKCILLIEDHPDSCDALKAMLERRGARAECAATLQEGRVVERSARMAGRPFDCIVCDIGLPQVTYHEVIEALQGFISNGIPVRAISGTSNPEVVAACANAKVALIMKTTPAEGIMESVLYALAENPKTGNIDEIAPEIIANSASSRVIPKEKELWFFTKWPKWAQLLSSILMMVTLGTTVTSIGIATIKTLDAKAIARETARQTAEEVNRNITNNTTQIGLQGQWIRALQDSKIQVTETLKIQGQTLLRIEDKLDRFTSDTAKVNAMWRQRLEGKTNEQLRKEGVRDTIDGPSYEEPSPSPIP